MVCFSQLDVMPPFKRNSSFIMNETHNLHHSRREKQKGNYTLYLRSNKQGLCFLPWFSFNVEFSGDSVSLDLPVWLSQHVLQMAVAFLPYCSHQEGWENTPDTLSQFCSGICCASFYQSRCICSEVITFHSISFSTFFSTVTSQS